MSSYKDFERFSEWKSLLEENSSLKAGNAYWKSQREHFAEVAPYMVSSKGKDHLLFYMRQCDTHRESIAKQRARISELEAIIDASNGGVHGTKRPMA